MTMSKSGGQIPLLNGKKSRGLHFPSNEDGLCLLHRFVLPNQQKKVGFPTLDHMLQPPIQAIFSPSCLYMITSATYRRQKYSKPATGHKEHQKVQIAHHKEDRLHNE